MNIRTTRMGLEKSSWLGLCAVLLVAAPASAQNQRYYPQQQGGYAPQQPQYGQPPPNYQQPPPGYGGYGYPQQQPQTRYESPIEFLPKFGKRMSEMVRRVFYGEGRSGYDYPQQGGPNGGYSLEEPPPQRQYSAAPTYPQQPPAGYQYPPQQGQGQAQPRYSYPPQSPQQPPVNPTTRNTQPLPPPLSRSSVPPPSTQSKSTPRTYSPPKVSQTPPKTTSKSSSSSSTTKSSPSKPKEQPPAPAPTPPPTTTTRRSESTPPPSPQTSSNTSSLGSGSFLKGKKASKPGRVISPYPPYKELDITGLESGSLALDPTTQKVFEVP